MEIESEQTKNSDLPKNEASSALAGIDSLGILSAIFLGTIYLCGFLTLNSHLYKYGVVELGIASTEYLVAGAIFVIYLVVYGLFAGRGMVMSQRWLEEKIEHLKESGAPAVSPLVVYFCIAYPPLYFPSLRLNKLRVLVSMQSSQWCLSLVMQWILRIGISDTPLPI
jgi:hypothetical protein